MPADPVAHRAQAIVEHLLVVLADRVVVPCRGEQVQPPAIPAPVGRALKAAQEIALEQTLQRQLPSCVAGWKSRKAAAAAPI